MVGFKCHNSNNTVFLILGLEEWWALEHTLWTLLILQSLPIVLKRAGGDKGKILLQILTIVQVLI